MILFLAVTARQQAVVQKLKNYFTKWRQVQQKIPLPEMTELHITPQLPEYPKIANDVFMLLAGWQVAVADGDPEVPEAVGASASAPASTPSAQAGTRSQGRRGSGCCRRRGCRSHSCRRHSRREEEGKGPGRKTSGSGCTQSGDSEGRAAAKARQGEGRKESNCCDQREEPG